MCRNDEGKKGSGSVALHIGSDSYRFPGTRDRYDAELDIHKEKRTQKYLIIMISTFALALLPLILLTR